METHLGWALKTKGEKGALPVFDKIGAEDIAEELKEAGLPVNGKTRLYDGRTGEAFQRRHSCWSCLHHEANPHG